MMSAVRYGGIAIAVLAAGWALRRYCNGPLSKYDHTNTNLEGRTIIITGANSGLGKQSALDLAKMKATVVLACRDRAKAEQAARDIRAQVQAEAVGVTPKVEAMSVDVSDLDSVRSFAAAYRAKFHGRCDVLMHNAGVLTKDRKLSKQGYELTFATNYLGPYLLTRLLEPELSNATGRVIMVGSGTEGMGSYDAKDLQFEHKAFDGNDAYSQSKIAGILIAEEMARRYPPEKIKVIAMQPGLVPETAILRDGPTFTKAWMTLFSPLIWLLSKDLKHGAATQTQLAAAPHSELVSGAYYRDCFVATPRNRWSGDRELARTLWNLSEQLAGLKKDK